MYWSDFLFCWLRACCTKQESWLLSSPCREANSTARESREKWDLKEGGTGSRHLHSASLVLTGVRISGVGARGWCFCNSSIRQLWLYSDYWAQSSRPESWNCNLQVLFVLFHFDEEKNSFIEIKMEGEGSHPQMVSWHTLNLGSVSHTWMHRPEWVYTMHQISGCWINMSSSLAWYSLFFLLVNCKFYLKINTVPNSLLHSASAVLGLISSLSFLEEQWRVHF